MFLRFLARSYSLHTFNSRNTASAFTTLATQQIKLSRNRTYRKKHLVNAKIVGRFGDTDDFLDSPRQSLKINDILQKQIVLRGKCQNLPVPVPSRRRHKREEKEYKLKRSISQYNSSLRIMFYLTKRRIKGQQKPQYRTLFGVILVSGLRVYRCHCEEKCNKNSFIFTMRLTALMQYAKRLQAPATSSEVLSLQE